MILETYFLACSPTAYAVAAIVTAIAGSAVTLTAQQNQAEAQSEYQTNLGRENNKAAARQAEMARDEQAQAKEAAARDAAAAALASKRATASALTAAGESGVSGNSVDALLRDFRWGRMDEVFLAPQGSPRAGMQSPVAARAAAA